ncbi:UDP-N-acetylmuramate--L-alanine ligase [Bienertia sinuspersici]
MPALYITTNVKLEEVDIEPIFSEATAAVASIIGRPQHVCVVPSVTSCQKPMIVDLRSIANILSYGQEK